MSESVVRFEGVDFSYGAAPVLESVDLEIRRGSFVSVIGPNGGGKTTLARLAIGLLEPTRGRVLLFDKAPRTQRSRVGYVPQYAQFDPHFPISVIDVVLMGRLRKAAGFYSRQDREEARSALETVGLADLERRQYSRLSGGQRQRVLIARALASRPEILLLDEPTASVDVAVERRLSTLLAELNRSLTVIVITHDLGFASASIDQLICVNHTARIHPTAEVTDEMIKRLYENQIRFVDHATTLGA